MTRREDFAHGWAERIEAEQATTTVIVAGAKFLRVRYGEESLPAGFEWPDLCHDCGCELGQVHVTACCVEACPRCLGQRASCACEGGEVLH